jgi:uncharacterized membrane protein YbhN (UPF0104 family)
MDVHEIVSIIKAYPLYKIFLVCLWFLLSFVFLGLRLHALKPDLLLLSLCIKASFLGQLASSIFPARIGEGAKGLYILKNSTTAASAIISLILWERFADLNMLFLIMLLAAGLSLPVHLFQTCCALLFLLWAFLGSMFILHRANFPWNKRLKIEWLRHLTDHLFSGMRLSVMIRVFMFSVLVWGQFFIETYMAVNWIGNINLNFIQILNVFIISAIALAIPFAPGSLGTFEAAFVFSLGRYGIDTNQAVAVAILIRAIQYIPLFIAAFIMALAGGQKFKNTLMPAFSQKCN